MGKRILVVISTLLLLLSTGCGESAFFSNRDIPPDYSNTEELDKKFLSAIKSSGKTNNIFTDEEYIKYGKSMCILLDKSSDPYALIEDYEGEDQAISDAAIQIYCPQYLK